MFLRAFVMRIALGVIALFAAFTLRAQPAVPEFEVASIKLVGQGCNTPLASLNQTQAPGRFREPCSTIGGLILRSFVGLADGVHMSRETVPAEGAPAWLNTDFYTIEAVAKGNPTRTMMEGPMLRKLLEDRFKLQAHFETREVPVYALTVAKGGPKLKAFDASSCTRLDYNNLGPRQQGQLPYCENAMGNETRTTLFVHSEGKTLEEFSKMVSIALDRPVIDRTGLAGLFNFKLKFAVDDTTPIAQRNGANAPDPSTQPTFSTAIEEQLGLKLERSRGPGRFLVIDHIERPSEN